MFFFCSIFFLRQRKIIIIIKKSFPTYVMQHLSINLFQNIKLIICYCFVFKFHEEVQRF